MSSPRPPLTEARLDRMLDRWLGEGPDTVADRVPEAALLIVATRRQKRRGFLGRLAVDTRVGRLAAAGAVTVVVVAVGFGLWRGSQVIVQPSPSPSVSPSSEPTPTPSPEPTPAALESFAYPELGWQIDLPANWEVAEPSMEFSDFRAFGAEGSLGGRLDVSLGTPEGSVQICYQGACRTEIVTSLGDFGTRVFGTTGPFGSLVRESGPLVDGEPSWLYQPVDLNLDPPVSVTPGPDTYVVALHGGRPLFVHFAPEPGVPNTYVRAILREFRFLDPITLTPFRSEDGYSVSVPAGWMERPGVDCPGLQIFSGVGEPYGYGSVLISYGQPDGSFYLIDAADTCWAESATGLLGLREALLRTGDFPIPAQFGSNHDTDLGGEAAWLFVGREFLATDPTFWVVAFHDGRPVVLHLRFSSIDPYPSPITEIVASFQYQD